MPLNIEILLGAVIAIISAILQLQISRGNKIAEEIKESLQEVKRQHNENFNELQDYIRGQFGSFKDGIDRDIERTASINFQLSQNLRETKYSIDSVLSDIKKTNLELLAKIEILKEKIDINGSVGTKTHDK